MAEQRDKMSRVCVVDDSKHLQNQSVDSTTVGEFQTLRLGQSAIAILEDGPDRSFTPSGPEDQRREGKRTDETSLGNSKMALLGDGEGVNSKATTSCEGTDIEGCRESVSSKAAISDECSGDSAGDTGNVQNVSLKESEDSMCNSPTTDPNDDETSRVHSTDDGVSKSNSTCVSQIVGEEDNQTESGDSMSNSTPYTPVPTSNEDSFKEVKTGFLEETQTERGDAISNSTPYTPVPRSSDDSLNEIKTRFLDDSKDDRSFSSRFNKDLQGKEDSMVESLESLQEDKEVTCSDEDTVVKSLGALHEDKEDTNSDSTQYCEDVKKETQKPFANGRKGSKTNIDDRSSGKEETLGHPEPPREQTRIMPFIRAETDALVGTSLDHTDKGGNPENQDLLNDFPIVDADTELKVGQSDQNRVKEEGTPVDPRPPEKNSILPGETSSSGLHQQMDSEDKSAQDAFVEVEEENRDMIVSAFVEEEVRDMIVSAFVQEEAEDGKTMVSVQDSFAEEEREDGEMDGSVQDTFAKGEREDGEMDGSVQDTFVEEERGDGKAIASVQEAEWEDGETIASVQDTFVEEEREDGEMIALVHDREMMTSPEAEDGDMIEVKFNVNQTRKRGIWYYSKKVSFDELAWQVVVGRHARDKLFIGLRPAASSEERYLHCEVDYRIKLVNDKDESRSMMKRRVHTFTLWGVQGLFEFLPWRELLDEQSGFVDRDNFFRIQVLIKVIYD